MHSLWDYHYDTDPSNITVTAHDRLLQVDNCNRDSREGVTTQIRVPGAELVCVTQQHCASRRSGCVPSPGACVCVPVCLPSCQLAGRLLDDLAGMWTVSA